MNLCLICNETVRHDLNWGNLLLQDQSSLLCEACHSNMTAIKGKVCQVCGRQSNLDCCQDCERWRKFYNGEDVLSQNTSLYIYNDFMQTLITQWKYRGDYALGKIFEKDIKSYCRKQKLPKETLIVSIPLSSGREYHRAFNQADQIAAYFPMKKIMCFKRKSSEKQSKKSRHERLLTQNPFELIEKIKAPVLLVDDIYTTGRTLRHAAELLKAQGCPQIFSFTIVRS